MVNLLRSTVLLTYTLFISHYSTFSEDAALHYQNNHL